MSARLPLRALARTRVAVPPVSRPSLAAAVRFASSSEASSSKTPATPAAADVKGKAKDVKNEANNGTIYPVPPLARPLGVYAAPTSEPKSAEQKRKELLDAERHKAKRRALIKEASQGYFHDYNLARKHNGGKLYLGPPVLIREDAALYFPDLTGKALNGKMTHTTDLFKGNVSLVTILNTRISEEHANSFVEPVLEDWEGAPHFNYVQINHQANPLKSMLLSFFTSSMKRTISEDRWATYMVSSGEWSDIDITTPLGIENKLLGYVFLVDSNAKVRWAGCGLATEKETADLRRATAVLMRRAQEDAEKAKTAQ